MKQQGKKKKRYSKTEKLKILKEAKANGVGVTLSKYGIYSATYYNWKKSYDLYQQEGLDIKGYKEAKQEIKRLKAELMQYKSMLAESQLEGRLKDELIKKKYAKTREL